MWKIFWHEIGVNQKATAYIYMFPGLCSVSMISFNKSKIFAGIAYLLFFIVCVALSVMLPQVPRPLFLAPLDKEKRIHYVRNVFWFRVGVFLTLSIALRLFVYLFKPVSLVNIIADVFVWTWISFTMGLLDYYMSYKDTTDVQKIGYMMLMFLNIFLIIVSANVEIGDSIWWSISIIIISMLGLIHLVRSYYKYYDIMLDTYSDYEKYQNRPVAYANKGRGVR